MLKYKIFTYKQTFLNFLILWKKFWYKKSLKEVIFRRFFVLFCPVLCIFMPFNRCKALINAVYSLIIKIAQKNYSLAPPLPPIGRTWIRLSRYQSVRYESCLDQSEGQKDTSHVHACEPNRAKDKAQAISFGSTRVSNVVHVQRWPVVTSLVSSIP